MMFMKKLLLTLLSISLLGAGCFSEQAQFATPSGDTISVNVVREREDIRRGLSGRKNIGDGMLFCMGEPSVQQFWMFEMEHELDMIWILDEEIVAITRDVPILTNDAWTIRSSGDEANIVLEVPAGMSDAWGYKEDTPAPEFARVCEVAA